MGHESIAHEAEGRMAGLLTHGNEGHFTQTKAGRMNLQWKIMKNRKESNQIECAIGDRPLV